MIPNLSPEEIKTTAFGMELTFQERSRLWLEATFNIEYAEDKHSRNLRFLEEALELVQSTGLSKEACLQLVYYVFSRPIGETPQEVGGVMTTLSCLCTANKVDMMNAAETELSRCWLNQEKIKAKTALKPGF